MILDYAIEVGRICLDILKMQPKGSWRPSMNLATVLTSVRLLLAEPNPLDPLMADIANEYQFNRQQFLETAKGWTKQYACPINKSKIARESYVHDLQQDK